jgi:O-methyltransferase
MNNSALRRAEETPDEKSFTRRELVGFSAYQKFRHSIKKIPYANEFYDFFTTVFCPGYAEDGLRASKNCGFLSDREFLCSYDALLRQDGNAKNRWRAHVTQWAAFHASKLPGDFVETGVDRGCFSASVCSYVDFASLQDKTFFLIDTFGGLIADLVSEEERAAFKNEYADTYQFVKDSFSRYPNVEVVRGVVPDVLETIPFSQIAYLSIDLNCATPERSALEFFWPLLVGGGIVVLDDYGFPGRGAQQETADEFARTVGARVLSVPTGQGILIKSS